MVLDDHFIDFALIFEILFFIDCRKSRSFVIALVLLRLGWVFWVCLSIVCIAVRLGWEFGDYLSIILIA